MTRRVAVTGIGVIAAPGTTRAAFWESLRAGHSAIRPMTLVPEGSLRFPNAAEVLDYRASDHMGEKEADLLDRFAQFAESEGRPLDSLLDEFASLRRENLRALSDLRLTEADLDRRGRHPVFGAVTLRQLLATWMAHDLDHVVQISRVLARQYATEVGPWTAYLRIISGQQG